MASNYQYEEPRIPERWSEAERRFAVRVIEALEDLYSRQRDVVVAKLVSKVASKYVRTDDGSLHVGDSDSGSEVLIDSDSVSILIDEIVFAAFGVGYAQFGNYRVRQSSDGGLTFDYIEEAGNGSAYSAANGNV